MGNLIVQQFVSADGVAANDRDEFDRMYAGYWPTPAADHELVGPRINSLPKYVIDLLRLVILPVALGSGRGVFPTESRTQLRLTRSETVGGLVAVDYAVA